MIQHGKRLYEIYFVWEKICIALICLALSLTLAIHRENKYKLPALVWKKFACLKSYHVDIKKTGHQHLNFGQGLLSLYYIDIDLHHYLLYIPLVNE